MEYFLYIVYHIQPIYLPNKHKFFIVILLRKLYFKNNIIIIKKSITIKQYSIFQKIVFFYFKRILINLIPENIT